MKKPPTNVRERLLRAALHAFTARGYSAASVREIVESCAVTKPTLYYYFGSKERLYRTLIAETFAESNRRIARIAASPLPPAGKLEAVVEHYLNYGRQKPDQVRLIMTALYRSDACAPEMDMRVHILPNLQAIAGIIEEGIRSRRFPLWAGCRPTADTPVRESNPSPSGAWRKSRALQACRSPVREASPRGKTRSSLWRSEPARCR